MKTRPFVAGNWKSNGCSQTIAAWSGTFQSELQDDTAGRIDILVCPPVVYLDICRSLLPSWVSLGAQNISAEGEGAFTGEVTAGMLTDSGAGHAIIGHSERRRLYAETDAVVAQKYLQAQHASLTPIVCIGETLAERQAGEAQKAVQHQLLTVLETSPGHFRGLVAYEPVWAIGTGEAATPAEAAEMHGFIRQVLRDANCDEGNIPLLYGGSVNPGNAARLYAEDGIDGFLVGGASNDATAFAEICREVLKPG